MTVLITLTIAGADSGPFDLYTNLDGYVSAFATGVSKSALLAGYTSSAVPDFATIIRVKSNGDCVNYIDIVLQGLTTTTTTTVAPTTTTTTTTLVANTFSNSGISNINEAGACSNAISSPTTLYSNCVFIVPGCFIYINNTGTPLTGNAFIYTQCCGNFDVNTTTGEVTAVSANQC